MPIAHTGGGPRLKGYSPQLYSPTLEKKFWDNTILRKITNSDFEGKFADRGSSMILRCPPIIETSAYIDGVPPAYQDPSSEIKTVTIDRARSYAFRVKKLAEKFSDLKNWANTWTNLGAKQLAQDVEKEFFRWAYLQVPTQNQGTAAGKESGSFNLGTGTAPVAVFDTDDKAKDSTYADGGKNSATRLITDMDTVLAENPGGDSLNPFVIIPPWYANLVQNGDLKHADLSGDSVSLLRRNALTSIGKIGRMTVYVSNLLPKLDVAGKNYKAVPIMFGDAMAMSFFKEVTMTKMFEDKDEPTSDFHFSVIVYDMFARYPQFFGTAMVVNGRVVG